MRPGRGKSSAPRPELQAGRLHDNKRFGFNLRLFDFGVKGFGLVW